MSLRSLDRLDPDDVVAVSGSPRAVLAARCEVTVSVIAGGTSTGVRASTVPSLVVSVELPPAGSVPADVMDPALAPPPTGASDGS